MPWNASSEQPFVKWTASNSLSYNTYGDSYMLPSALRVEDGVLNITGTKRSHLGASYIGGQLTTWNRMCYQGGYLEVRYKAPGVYGQDGNWPAIWTMGFLVRDNHMIRNLNLWPYSYSECSCPGSQFYGVGFDQAISACSARADYGMNPFQGRGAVELDLLEISKCSHFYSHLAEEAGVAEGDSCLLQSTQIGPRIPSGWRPYNYFEPDANRPWYGHPWNSSSTRTLEYWNGFFMNVVYYGFNWFDSIGAVAKASAASFVQPPALARAPTPTPTLDRARTLPPTLARALALALALALTGRGVDLLRVAHGRHERGHRPLMRDASVSARAAQRVDEAA